MLRLMPGRAPRQGSLHVAPPHEALGSHDAAPHGATGLCAHPQIAGGDGICCCGLQDLQLIAVAGAPQLEQEPAGRTV